MSFFSENDYYSGPAFTADMATAAQRALGFRLPASYLELLKEKNGGIPHRRCFPVSEQTSWASDHIEIASILGLGGKWGLDSDAGLGSADMINEWGYPKIGVVICVTPSGGHDTVMLDYRACGPDGEPSVVYVNDDRSITKLAPSFGEFIKGLKPCEMFRGAQA